MPTYGVVGSSTSTVTSDVYTRKLAIDIVTSDTLNSEKPDKVYEGRVTSKGSCGAIAEVMDEMLEALFSKFPNGSGLVEVPGTFNC